MPPKPFESDKSHLAKMNTNIKYVKEIHKENQGFKYFPYVNLSISFDFFSDEIYDSHCRVLDEMIILQG